MPKKKRSPSAPVWARSGQKWILERIPPPTARSVVAASLCVHAGRAVSPGVPVLLLAVLGVGIAWLVGTTVGSVITCLNGVLVPSALLLAPHAQDRFLVSDPDYFVVISVLVLGVALQGVAAAVYPRLSFRLTIPRLLEPRPQGR